MQHNMSSPSEQPEQTKDGGVSQSDWKSHAELLLDKLDRRREEKVKYEAALKRLVSTHEIASEEVERLKREVDLRDDDIKYLWEEIRALRHGFQQWREFREEEIQVFIKQRENSDRKIAYFESVVQRQESIIKRLEQEIVVRAEHFETLKQCAGWKIGKTLSREALGAPLDLSTLGPISPEIHEPTYEEIPLVEPKAEATPFERTFKPNERLAKGFHATLENPRSFASSAVGQLIRFSGWCCDKDGKAASRVWASIGAEETPCAVGVLRQDVVVLMAAQIEVVSNCGFQGEISTGPGENFIEIHAEFEDCSHAVLFKRIVVNLGFEHTPKRQLDDDYQSWIQCFDTLSASDLRKMEGDIDSFEYKPLISILLPVYNTEEKWLSQVIESVLSQTYSNWELCIADDASPSVHVKEMLDHYRSVDDRIKVVYRPENGHISAATNSALQLANGEFCALLDHDDLLPIHALYYVAKELNGYPQADLLFSDEDKIDFEGRRFDPYFKSDWNPDLFLSHNCISHLGVYRTSILLKIEGFKEELYGSQDWDMALRFLLHTSPDKIRHIPRVLYHWRYLDSSTSKSIDSKPYAVVAGKKAIENYLESRGKQASVTEGMWPGAYRVKYALETEVKASIIIPTRDQAKVTRQCIESVLNETTYSNFEVLLIDNQSTEPETLEFFESLEGESRVRVLKYNHPFNFSAINNYAVTESTGEVLVFLNNDIEVFEPGWLEELVSQAMRPEVGVAGAWLLYPDHSVQHAGILMGVCGIAVEAFKHQLEWSIGHMGRAHLNQSYSAVTGACLATRKTVFEQLNGFNEDELAVAYNDVDFCLRASRDAGLATVWTPYAKLIHHESVSRGYDVSEEKKLRIKQESDYMMKTWAHVIAKDPFYNPNLTQFNPQFGLAWPPRVEIANQE